MMKGIWDRLPPLGLASAILIGTGAWLVKVGARESGRSLLAAGLVVLGGWVASEIRKGD